MKVRVGGGYLSVYEFTDQYLPIEFEKFGGQLWRYSAGQNVTMDASYE